MEIRPATPADAGALVTLLEAQLVEHDIHLAPEALRRAVQGALAPEHGCVLVAADAVQGVVGFAYLGYVWTLEHGGRSAWLEELHVARAHRGRGLGTQLLEAALEAAREAGCLAVDLDVEASHARVQALYARAGFRPHTRARWWRPLN